MCELCDAATLLAHPEAAISALLDALFGPVIDYFDEYRTESEADLTGNGDLGPWKVSVAKVGGGTVGKTYPAGEDWILQFYQDGELVNSMVGNPPFEMTHEEALREAAQYYFDYQG